MLNSFHSNAAYISTMANNNEKKIVPHYNNFEIMISKKKIVLVALLHF